MRSYTEAEQGAIVAHARKASSDLISPENAMTNESKHGRGIYTAAFGQTAGNLLFAIHYKWRDKKEKDSFIEHIEYQDTNSKNPRRSLMWVLGVSRSSLIRARKVLVESGAITIKNGAGFRVQYVLNEALVEKRLLQVETARLSQNDTASCSKMTQQVLQNDTANARKSATNHSKESQALSEAKKQSDNALEFGRAETEKSKTAEQSGILTAAPQNVTRAESAQNATPSNDRQTNTPAPAPSTPTQDTAQLIKAFIIHGKNGQDFTKAVLDLTTCIATAADGTTTEYGTLEGIREAIGSDKLRTLDYDRDTAFIDEYEAQEQTRQEAAPTISKMETVASEASLLDALSPSPSSQSKDNYYRLLSTIKITHKQI
ncbi:hypothetical protein FACS1894103_1690 [Campylobacterota bacterium]|nr:hypothetical protein FACS1894103_1690 [Campylobacterota bacterium]